MSECDFILDQYELYGVEYIDSLLDDGYIPVYVSGIGWRWILKADSNVLARSS